jgi:diguanylate cyclase (GGDEF)-like protein
VTSDGSEPRFSLLDAARVLARGRDLDQKLESLAYQARAIAGTSVAVVLLYDPETDTVSEVSGTPLSLDEAASQVISEREPVWNASAGVLAPLVGGSERAALVPLVVEDELGPAVEGLLATSADDASPDAGAREVLLALGDLAAVAIRQARLHSALAERAEYLERLARTDGLTGLADRRTFDQMLELELARADRQATPLTVVVFGIDGFAELDGHDGSRTRDDALRVVASTLADRVRLVDTVARIGLDEFGVIAPGDPNGIVARRVVEAVAGLPPIGSARVSVSAGVAHHPDDGATGTDLLAAAQSKMEDARRQGTGVVAGARDQVG